MIHLNGNEYIRKKSLNISSVNSNLPQFGHVRNVYMINSALFQHNSTICYVRDYMAYKIEIPVRFLIYCCSNKAHVKLIFFCHVLSLWITINRF